jgi:predicted metal-dependent phosphoesterase TrpH
MERALLRRTGRFCYDFPIVASTIDLHTHSSYSDGLLTPAQLVQSAQQNGVRLLALTDHDGTCGLEEARQAAAALNVALINGVEISVTWESRTVHVVGLRIDPGHAALAHGLERLRAGRVERAQRIAAALERIGVDDCLAEVLRHAQGSAMVGRMHFARLLVERKFARDVRAVFKKYLVKGKPGYVSHEWASLDEAVGWIAGSGGAAVLAHPGCYDLSRAKLLELLRQFKEAGGSALEVVSGGHESAEAVRFARYCVDFGLFASQGSDFHAPREGRQGPGVLEPLPQGCTPLWQQWPETVGLPFTTARS